MCRKGSLRGGTVLRDSFAIRMENKTAIMAARMANERVVPPPLA